jgi:hypothetical protein
MNSCTAVAAFSGIRTASVRAAGPVISRRYGPAMPVTTSVPVYPARHASP